MVGSRWQGVGGRSNLIFGELGNAYYSHCKQFNMTLDEAQESVDAYIKNVGVRYFNELTNLGILVEEVGELSRLMVRTYGEQSFKESDKGRELGDEMADVLWVLICLANQTGVNLTEAFDKNLAKKLSRDATRHRDNPKLQSGHGKATNVD